VLTVPDPKSDNLNGAGREKWHTSNINQILRNEKYIGDALPEYQFL